MHRGCTDSNLDHLSCHFAFGIYSEISYSKEGWLTVLDCASYGQQNQRRSANPYLALRDPSLEAGAHLETISGDITLRP